MAYKPEVHQTPGGGLHVHNPDGTVGMVPKWGGRCQITSVDRDDIVGVYEGFSEIFPGFLEFTEEETGTAIYLNTQYNYSIIPLEDCEDGTVGNTGTD